MVSRLRSLWRNLIHRQAVERDLDDELGTLHAVLTDENVGMLLAAIGIYGVTAYTVTRRTREIGVRLAMGAQRSDVLLMVLRQGMSLVAIGSAIGLILAAASSHVLVRLLVGVPPLDPLAFAASAVLLSLIGLAACYVPARRAMRISAVEALRYE